MKAPYTEMQRDLMALTLVAFVAGMLVGVLLMRLLS